MERIMVVDDEESIRTLLEFNLTKVGYEVSTVADGQAAYEKAQTEKFDLIVLDLMLPGKDGLEVCRELRNKGIMTPVLMLTAKDEEIDKIHGLDLGADDYMTKPFSPREVIARVKAILRRIRHNEHHSETGHEEQIVIGEVVLYPERYEVFFRGEGLTLTPKEFSLLMYLMKNKGRALSREVLLGEVFEYEFYGDTRIVDVHVSHLREKIEADTRKPQYIKTVRGIGYKMEEPKTL